MRYEPDKNLSTSINDMITPGTHGVYTATPDFPTGYGSWGLLEVQAYGSICYQIIKFETNTIISRAKIVNQTEWSKWKRICDNGNADTLDGLHVNEIASNPNLLINPDFKINQRGKSEYIGVREYGVDRWASFGASVTPTSNGVTVSVLSDSSYYGFVQAIEYSDTVNNTFTLSAKINGKVYSGTVTVLTADTEYIFFNIDNGAGRFVISYSSSLNATVVQLYGFATNEIEWVKLEIGPIATQYIQPNSTMELLKCRRFYYKNRYVITFPSAYDNIWCPINAQFPVEMRPFRFYNLYSLNGTANVLSKWSDSLDSSISAIITPGGVSANGFSSLHSPNSSFSLERAAYSFIAEFDSEIG